MKTEKKLAVMFLDEHGLPRAYAVGPEATRSDILVRAWDHIRHRCARTGEDPSVYKLTEQQFEITKNANE